MDGMREIHDTRIEHGVESVIFSGIVTRKCRPDIEEKRLLANALLKDACETDWCSNGRYVDNSNIVYNDLYKDGLHLVENGSVKLANNILNCVNNNNARK